MPHGVHGDNPHPGTSWFIEGDIAGCFDNIDHKVLLEILGENIQDNRFLQLPTSSGLATLRIGSSTLPSGTPQGSVVSPVLANVYLDRLDRFAEDVLLDYNRGKERRRKSTDIPPDRTSAENRTWQPSLRQHLRTPSIDAYVHTTPTTSCSALRGQSTRR